MRFTHFRLVKTLTVTALCALIWLTWRLVTGHLDWGLALGCAALSGFWLALTAVRLRQLLTTYFDFLSRLQVILPLSLGACLSVVAMAAVRHWSLYVLSIGELLGWTAVYLHYRATRKQYIIQGHGPLPANAWVNPPAAAWQPFDIGLFSGRMAARLRDSVGHGEVAIRAPDGRLLSFSSFMPRGVDIQDLEEVTSRQLKQGHYIVLRLKQAVTAATIEQAFHIAQEMLADNIRWRQETNARRERFFNSLPLPAAWRSWLIGKTRATGYDWLGLLIGARAPRRWTCVGAVIELLERLGIKLNKYGTGLFGLGTGLLNPIMPVRFLSDPHLRLLTIDDQQAFNQSKHQG